MYPLCGSVMENSTFVTGCEEVQPDAASVLIEAGEIVGGARLAAMSKDTVFFDVGVAEVPLVQYARRSM